MSGFFQKTPYQFHIGFLFILIGLASCTGGKKTEDNPAKGSLEENHLIITKKQYESGNMLVGKITEQQFTTSVKTNGMIAVLPQNRAEISPYFGGYIKNIKLLPGDKVEKGQVLFTMENPAFVEVQRDFLEAMGQLRYLKSDYKRQQELLADNVSSEKKFLKAEAAYKVTLAQYQSLKKKLWLMNINPDKLTDENITSVIQVRSPLSGYATKIMGHKGSYLNPEDIALTVTNTDHLHIELKIFEQDLPLLKIGQRVTVKLQKNTNTTYPAKITLINKAIDLNERTIEIHADFLNEKDNQHFVPGMYVTGEILTDIASYKALPSEAVVSIEDQYYVLVKKHDSVFERKEVKVGMNNGGFIQIINSDDFKTEAQFLTKGAFNLIAE
jgi:cobalt-zinc-cadmium efflux system membrane fusion protein